MDFDVAIVGAGPFGLSSATHLKAKGIGIGIFGDPMSFWQNHMPAGMYLRSNWEASQIADPHQKLTLEHFKADTGLQFEQPIPLERFVEYGQWYQQKGVRELSRRQVTNVERNGNGFRISLDDGQTVTSKRAIIATGIAHFPYIAPELSGHPKTHVTHSSDHSDLSLFRGKQVLVVGGGQSALDAARILHSYDSKVEIVAKQEQIRWVGQHRWLHHLGFLSWCLYSNFDVGPAGISRLVGFPNVFRRLPRAWQDPISYRATRPAGTGWQKPYLDKVPITLGTLVASSEILGDRVHLKLSNGTDRLVDHVVVATGYKCDTSRYGFFGQGIREGLKTVKGSPVLARGLESSVPGLHFVGKPAAWSFGPLLNFISGAHFASAELLRAF